MPDQHIAVVKLTASFSDFWDQLAADLGIGVVIIDPSEPLAGPGDVLAVLLAAGGDESEAGAWIESNSLPTGIPVYAVGADPSRRTAIRLMSRGVTDYFVLPEDVEVLRNALEARLEKQEHAARRTASLVDAAKAEAFEQIVGESPALKETLSRAERILQRKDTTALIIGETGTGKELLVRALHDGGPRATGPFVAVNCAALPANLVESELFGHERGAFTDAHAAKPGLFEIADRGTLFLDELGTLPLEVQAKLLRVLEDGEIRRVGATKTHRVDVRVIAATSDQLAQAVASGSFRQDLYFRLSVITLVLPPLRERGDDVLLIGRTLLQDLARRHESPVPDLTPEVVAALRGYHWPGNVRELKNALERAMLLSQDGRLDPGELLPAASGGPHSGGPIPFPAELDIMNEAAARATLAFCGGNRSHAARRLGISRQRLRRLLDAERESA